MSDDADVDEQTTDVLNDHDHYLSDRDWAKVVAEAERIAAEREGEDL